MKRTSEQEQATEFRVGQRVQLDKQPFQWEITELEADGFKNRIRISRPGKDEITPIFRRTVDSYRLSVIPDSVPRRVV